MEGAGFYSIILVAGIFFLWIVLYYIPLNFWFQCMLSQVRISLLQLIMMRWHKVPPSIIVMAMLNSKKAGLDLNADQLEAHYLAGGNVQKVVNALILADKANIPLDFKAATVIDLSGRDVLESVQMSVNPKESNTHPVSAVAKDGIHIKSMYCYVNSNGQQQGPVSANDLPRYGVTPQTLVWRQGMSGWQPAGSVAELSGIFAAPPPFTSAPAIGAPSVVLCSKCGKGIEVGSAFCVYCGAQVEGGGNYRQPPTQWQQPSYAPQQPIYTAQPYVSPDSSKK